MEDCLRFPESMSSPHSLYEMLMSDSWDDPAEEHVQEYLSSLSNYLTSDQEQHQQAYTKVNQNDQSQGVFNTYKGKVCEYSPVQNEETKLVGKLIVECARAIESSDTKKAYNLVNKLREKASPKEGKNERLAYYFSEALVARITGTGSMLSRALSSSHRSIDEFLKAHSLAVQISPMVGLPIYFTNQLILEETAYAPRVHIVDFGIWHGFHLLCLIKEFSERPGGPPHLRITGVECPRHHKFTEDVGLRLSTYAHKLGVPFEYIPAVTEEWHSLQSEKLGVRRDAPDEVLIVTSIYRLRWVLDEPKIVHPYSPRRKVLANIYNMRPKVFVLGVHSTSRNSPSLVPRVKESFRYVNAVFDSIEETVSRNQPERQFIESVFGLDLLNLVACEGSDRRERPDNYHRWQELVQHAGFQQMVHRRHMCQKAVEMSLTYHKNYGLEKQGQWLVTSWKKEVLSAITAWTPR